jgi:hypothetical protein
MMKIMVNGYNISDAAEVAEMLKTCALMMERMCKEDKTDQLDCVAWRLADCGLMLRQLIDRTGYKNIGGYDKPTGRGAILPDSQDELYAVKIV